MSRWVSPIATVGWLSSLAIHATGVVWLVQSKHGERARLAPATVTLAVVAPRRPQPPAPAVHESTPPVSARPLAPSNLTAVARQPAKVAPRAIAPVDLTGVTLTGGDGAGWASMTGNGRAMDAPIRPAQAPVVTHLVAPSAPASVARPRETAIEVVAAKDLASKPAPPALDASLLANYPPLAKRQGVTGTAKLLVRIDADGVVRHCSVHSQSSSEFGAACRQTLLGSRWSTPRDRLGRAVVTQVYYTCDFRVNGS